MLPPEAEAIAEQVFVALADPSRRAILATLASGGPATATDLAGRLPGSLPYPVRKRVALARALAGEPDLVLLDEPASGLADDEMAEIGELIRGLTDRMSVMLVEHHMDLVMSVCDDIVVLDFGKVIARGGPDHVREHPAVLAAYLGEDVGDGVAEESAEPTGRP